MNRLEGWAFLSLNGCCVAVALAMTLMTGGSQLVVSLLGVMLGVLSGGLYAASVASKLHKSC